MKGIKNFLVIVAIGGVVGSAHASIQKASDYYYKNSRSIKYFPAVAKELLDEKLYFSAIPFIKEYLTAGLSSQDRAVDGMIEDIISEIGSVQFEMMPKNVLERSSAPGLHYVLAKKYMAAGENDRALLELNKILDKKHSSLPFALLMKGSILSIQGKYASAVDVYKRCIDVADDQVSSAKSANHRKQLELARDYCIVGIPRAEFAAGQYSSAHSSYMDLPKSSKVWPEILFEEAWTSFYLKDYNRTLGKLVTYQAPLFSHLFNPEIDILRALTYMEMCLWDDAKKVVDDFYSTYSADAQHMQSELNRMGKDYKYFYQLGKERIEGNVAGSKLKNQLLKTVIGDSAFGEMYLAFQSSSNELDTVNRLPGSAFKQVLLEGLKDSLIDQRNLIGSYVRTGMNNQMGRMDRAFEGMSYIKLEVLARIKAQIYQMEDKNGEKRGDINNLQRTSKQYFWNFNGEFWADELGDYVFSLKPECK